MKLTLDYIIERVPLDQSIDIINFASLQSLYSGEAGDIHDFDDLDIEECEVMGIRTGLFGCLVIEVRP